MVNAGSNAVNAKIANITVPGETSGFDEREGNGEGDDEGDDEGEGDDDILW